jgi:hypothetical protein
MKELNEVEIWVRVNLCESPAELSEAIISLADENGEIQGRSKKFDADRMASYVEDVVKGEVHPSILTREYGIRQQALYLKEYGKY